MTILPVDPNGAPSRGRIAASRARSGSFTRRTLAVIGLVTVGVGLLWMSSASPAQQPHADPVQAGNGNSSTPAAPTTPPPAPAGKPAATITAPTSGSTVAAGTAVTLTARGSADLVTALQAGTPRSCYFTVGDDANTSVAGTLDASTATCTATWTVTYKSAFSITGWFATASTIAYATPAITLNVTGSDSPRCTGAVAVGCAYKWAEVYYTSSTAYSGRVCGIDTCQWGSAHTSWSQVSGKDYWLNSTGSTLPDGNAAEAYLCIGTSSADWSTYSTGRNFASLLAQPETSASPLPSGTC